eukprot:TRINITY_DN1676_c0_g1_i1.p1 TRINITY_DN1676_c0_g1~~TRINITY_DN1676_c0_g1_i1.p1  ORF type:complete len:165 (+),score=35.68 TRINITY_DN1676_c0_g1_i1:233-727(+)
MASEQHREYVGQYTSTKPVVADGKAGGPIANDAAAAKANGKHIDDETIKQLTAKYAGGQVFPTTTHFGDAGVVKGTVQTETVEGTGRTVTTEKFKDNFSTSHPSRKEEEEKSKEGKPLYKRPLVLTTIVLGVTALVGFFLAGSSPSHRHGHGHRHHKHDESVTS